MPTDRQFTRGFLLEVKIPKGSNECSFAVRPAQFDPDIPDDGQPRARILAK
jgi:hypothetical protein